MIKKLTLKRMLKMVEEDKIAYDCYQDCINLFNQHE